MPVDTSALSGSGDAPAATTDEPIAEVMDHLKMEALEVSAPYGVSLES